MIPSVTDYVTMLTTVEQVVSSKLSDTNKQTILGEMLTSLPPRQLCVNTKGTRDIVQNNIQEAIDGFTATKAKSEKPKQSRARKTPTKSPKK